MDLAEVEKLGAQRAAANHGEFEALVEATRPDDTAILSTTSGTTGKPKLAMLTHRNLLAMAQSFCTVEPLAAGDEFLSFLPLPWIGEQMIGVACALWKGFTVNFPEEPETAQHRPARDRPAHDVLAAAHLGEHGLRRPGQDRGQLVGSSARSTAGRSARASGPPTCAWRSSRCRRGSRSRAGSPVWSASCGSRTSSALRRMKRAYTGGAALGPDIFRFFHALGVNLKQIYGQTEVSGISVLHRDGDVKFQTVGVPVPGTEIRIADNGEILTKSPAVFIGYYKNPEATAETLVDGWLHSGDAGYLDADGHLIVIDRAKDVMTLHDGTKFSPQFLENKLKWSPYVREAVVFGGDWPFVTALVTIDFANAGKWAEKRQLAYTTFTDLSQKPEVYALVRDHVARINADLPEAARIQRFLLLHKELDADDAELTRTRKVRRGFIAERYKTLVDALYGDRDAVAIETVITYQDGRTATTTDGASDRNDRAGSCRRCRGRVMDVFLQLTFTGLSNGMVYALVAVGFVIIYKASDVINFAQGEFLLLGAYLAFAFIAQIGLPWQPGRGGDAGGRARDRAGGRAVRAAPADRRADHLDDHGHDRALERAQGGGPRDLGLRAAQLPRLPALEADQRARRGGDRGPAAHHRSRRRAARRFSRSSSATPATASRCARSPTTSRPRCRWGSASSGCWRWRGRCRRRRPRSAASWWPTWWASATTSASSACASSRW